MIVEKILILEILIGRQHNVVEVAVDNLQIFEITDVAISGNLGTHCHVGNGG